MKTNRKTAEATKRPRCERGFYLGADSLLCFPCQSCTLTKEECEQLCPGERNESPILTPLPIPQSTAKATQYASHELDLVVLLFMTIGLVIVLITLILIVLAHRRLYRTHRPGYKNKPDYLSVSIEPPQSSDFRKVKTTAEEERKSASIVSKLTGNLHRKSHHLSVTVSIQQSSEFLKERITAREEICQADHSGVHQDLPKAMHTRDSNCANLTDQMESSLERPSQEDENNFLSQPSSCQDGGSRSLRSTVAAHGSWETFDDDVDDNGPVVSLEADAVSSQTEVDHDTRQASEDPDICMYDTPDASEDLYGPGSLPPGSHDFVSQSVHDYLEKLSWVRTTLSSCGKIEVMVKGIAQNTAKEHILQQTNIKRHQLTVTTFISSSFCYA